MSYVTVNGANIYYEDSAPDAPNKPVLLFAHGLLWSTRMYDKQVDYFRQQYRCIAFDFRGQGKSEITKDGYDMDTLTSDVVGLLDALNIEQCHLVGMSMGGFVAQRMAIYHPQRLASLILLETTSDPADPTDVTNYQRLINAVRWLGVKRVSKKVLPILFGESFLNDRSRKEECKWWLEQIEGNHKVGVIKAAQGAIARAGVYERLGGVRTPTLIIVGDEDNAIPYHNSERMHFAIAGSKLAIVHKAGHTVTVEAPEQINTLLGQFLETCAA
ncbi:alpha/beta fold hydrolase [Psychrobacter aestuarii]|uniref:Alpha/beta hydrolase n=1 Tax=Psychrobacter aestuarii TaxID=556327 RepID=A0ABN0VM96_9GAMM|nr:alpha/beta fold hydrolase [Psychrobacter aestuarii]